jgi:two-component system LytT family response regulator
MPVKTGFDLVNELKNYDVFPTVIFVTAFDKYAIEAIKHAAFDYLVKPVDVNDMQLCISRYKAEESHKHFTEKIENLLTNISKKKVKFNTREGFVFIDIDEIISCIAARNYTNIYLSYDNEKQTVTMNLGRLLEMLPANFIRINKSTVINKNFLKEVNRKTKKCKLVHNAKEYIFDIPKSYIKQL